MHEFAEPFAHSIFVQRELMAGWPLEEAERDFDAIPWSAGLNRPASVLKKHVCNNVSAMPAATRKIIANLNSLQTVAWIGELCGIRNLYADPTLLGAGMHMTLPGGYLKIHADFNWHPNVQMARRVNLLLYLNSDWREEWGGHLELWTIDMARCAKRIAPTMGTLVIFNTTNTSYHGHPHPLACPPNRSRRSIALYYYSPLEAGEYSDAHCTIYREPGVSHGEVAIAAAGPG